MIRRPPRSTLSSSSAASDVYKRQLGVRVGSVAGFGEMDLVPAPAVVTFDAVPGVQVVRGDQPVSPRRETLPVWGVLPPPHLLPARGVVHVAVELLDPDP